MSTQDVRAAVEETLGNRKTDEFLQHARTAGIRFNRGDNERALAKAIAWFTDTGDRGEAYAQAANSYTQVGSPEVTEQPRKAGPAGEATGQQRSTRRRPAPVHTGQPLAETDATNGDAAGPHTASSAPTAPTGSPRSAAVSLTDVGTPEIPAAAAAARRLGAAGAPTDTCSTQQAGHNVGHDSSDDADGSWCASSPTPPPPTPARRRGAGGRPNAAKVANQPQPSALDTLRSARSQGVDDAPVDAAAGDATTDTNNDGPAPADNAAAPGPQARPLGMGWESLSERVLLTRTVDAFAAGGHAIVLIPNGARPQYINALRPYLVALAREGSKDAPNETLQRKATMAFLWANYTIVTSKVRGGRRQRAAYTVNAACKRAANMDAPLPAGGPVDVDSWRDAATGSRGSPHPKSLRAARAEAAAKVADAQRAATAARADPNSAAARAAATHAALLAEEAAEKVTTKEREAAGRAKAQRVMELVRAGLLSRGAKAAFRDEALVKLPREELLRELLRLHPARPPDNNDEINGMVDRMLAGTAGAQLAASVTLAAVKNTIKKMCTGAAAGPDRLRAEHLRALCADTGCAEGIVAIVRIIVSGTLLLDAWSDVRALLLASTLVPISKPGKPGAIRPIALGGTLVKLAEAVVMLNTKSKAAFSDVFDDTLTPPSIPLRVPAEYDAATELASADYGPVQVSGRLAQYVLAPGASQTAAAVTQALIDDCVIHSRAARVRAWRSSDEHDELRSLRDVSARLGVDPSDDEARIFRRWFMPQLQPEATDRWAASRHSPVANTPVMLLIDAENAFNTVDRVMLLKKLARRGPDLASKLPLALTLLAHEEALMVVGGEKGDSFNVTDEDDDDDDDEAAQQDNLLASSTGVRQGSPASGPLFALAIHDTMQAALKGVANARGVLLADDTTVVGPAWQCAQVWKDVTRLLEKTTGCKPNPAKTEVVLLDLPVSVAAHPLGKQLATGVVANMFGLDKARFTQKAARLLGTVAGVEDKFDDESGSVSADDTFARLVDNVWGDVHESMEAQIDALGGLPAPMTLQAYHAMMRLSVAARPAFFARNTPPGMAQDGAGNIDNMVMNKWMKRVGLMAVRPDLMKAYQTHLRVGLPLRMGGMALRPYKPLLEVAYLARSAAPGTATQITGLLEGIDQYKGEYGEATSLKHACLAAAHMYALDLWPDDAEKKVAAACTDYTTRPTGVLTAVIDAENARRGLKPGVNNDGKQGKTVTFQRHYAGKVERARFELMLDRMDGDGAQARMEEICPMLADNRNCAQQQLAAAMAASTAGAAMALQAVPSEPGTELSNAAFVTILLTRMGLNLTSVLPVLRSGEGRAFGNVQEAEGALCHDCSQNRFQGGIGRRHLAAHPLHAADCPRYRKLGAFARHNHVLHALREVLVDVVPRGTVVDVEPGKYTVDVVNSDGEPTGKTATVMPDLVVSNNAHVVLVDVSLISAAAKSYAAATIASHRNGGTGKAAAATREKTKWTKYRPVVQTLSKRNHRLANFGCPVTFTGAVMELSGAMGDRLLSLLKDVAKESEWLGNNRVEMNSFLDNAQKRLAVAMYEGMAVGVLSAANRMARGERYGALVREEHLYARNNGALYRPGADARNHRDRGPAARREEMLELANE